MVRFKHEICNEKYEWLERYATDIENFIKKYPICSKAGEALMYSKNRVINTSYPNELWEVDLIGRIPDDKRNNNFIFIAVNHYTKWMETKRLRSKSANEIIAAI